MHEYRYVIRANISYRLLLISLTNKSSNDIHEIDARLVSTSLNSSVRSEIVAVAVWHTIITQHEY